MWCGWKHCETFGETGEYWSRRISRAGSSFDAEEFIEPLWRWQPIDGCLPDGEHLHDPRRIVEPAFAAAVALLNNNLVGGLHCRVGAHLRAGSPEFTEEGEVGSRCNRSDRSQLRIEHRDPHDVVGHG